LIRNSLILILALLAACDLVQIKNETESSPNAPQPIARVNNSFLYTSDLEGLIASGVSAKDSANLANAYINNWIRKQLLIDEASTQIEFDEAEIQRKILDYRYSLIAYEYKSFYINQNLNTEVTEEEIQGYYDNNLDNFPLRQNIIRGRFIRLPNDAPPTINIRRLIYSTRDDRVEELRKYCFNNALMYSLEDSVWINFDDIIKNTPLAEVPNKVDFLKRTKYTESSDETSKYYLMIKEYKKTDDIAPLEVVRDQIIDIIINKRKVELARNLEKEVYDKAVQTKAFEIY
jgi:hypothetical protein